MNGSSQSGQHEGFEIDVCTNADLETHPEVLGGASLYLSVGHDEYWSRGMRDTVEAFIARGGNAACEPPIILQHRVQQHLRPGGALVQGRALLLVVTDATLAGDEDHRRGRDPGDVAGIVAGAGDHVAHRVAGLLRAVAHTGDQVRVELDRRRLPNPLLGKLELQRDQHFG